MSIPEQAVAPTETDWVHACNAIVGTKEYYKHIQSSKGAMESLDLIERCLRYAADFIHTQPLVGVQCGSLETVADAIDAARYAHPDHPRERPRPFSEADSGDREYATRLARAVLALPHTGQPQEGPLVADTLLPLAAVEAEAQKCRAFLDNEPPNENSDMLYAAYNALLFVLSYGVSPPSDLCAAPASPRAEDWPKNGVRVIIKDEGGFHRHYYGTEFISIDHWPLVAEKRGEP